jgi:hypothetical protein
MKQSYGLLREFGDFIIANMHHTGYSEENILYRWARIGEVQDPPSRDKILCVDMPAHLQKVDLALKKLPNWEEKCVRMWFCAPLQEDGNPYTKRQLARKLRISKYKFEINLKNGQKNVKKLI